MGTAELASISLRLFSSVSQMYFPLPLKNVVIFLSRNTKTFLTPTVIASSPSFFGFKGIEAVVFKLLHLFLQLRGFLSVCQYGFLSRQSAAIF